MQLDKINIKIRNRRIELGYNSAEQFAFENKLNRSTYQRVEQGKNMTLDTLVKVAQALKIDLKELLWKNQLNFLQNYYVWFQFWYLYLSFCQLLQALLLVW